jgi:hypothetical protein
MKRIAPPIVLATAVLLAGCASTSWVDLPKQKIAWGDLTMEIPSTWHVTVKDDSLDAEDPKSGESVSITAFSPAPDFLAKSPSPLQIIEKTVENLSPPDPESPEVFTLRPYRIFVMPCGEPAAVVVQGLGGNEYTIAYSVASEKNMYSVNFYRTGTPARLLSFYQSMIESASIRNFPDSKCGL